MIGSLSITVPLGGWFSVGEVRVQIQKIKGSGSAVTINIKAPKEMTIRRSAEGDDRFNPDCPGRNLVVR